MTAYPSDQSGSNRANLPSLVPLGHHNGKPPVPLTRPVILIGSRSNARIHLVSSTVSKAHALLVKSNGAVYIRDLASRTHVYVNGEQVRDVDLNEGDLLKIGSFTFQFKSGSPQPGQNMTAPPAELEVTGSQLRIPVEERVLLIGRRGTCDIVLLEETASTAHAVIFEMDGERYVRDLGSRSGTFVNGVSTHQHKLAPGDVIHVGETDIRYSPAIAPATIEMASDSGAGYALEAPQEEMELPSTATGEEHETVGGLDLMGQMVREELARDAAARKPAQLAPEGPPETLEPIPLKEPEPEPAAATPAPSADIEDLQNELLGDLPLPAESLSPDASTAETSPEAADAANLSELHPRRGWRSTAGEEPPPEADLEAQADRAARQVFESPAAQPAEQAAGDEVEQPTESVEPAEATTEDQSSEVLRFPESSTATIDQDRFDPHAGASAAVLDQDALSSEPDDAELDVPAALPPLVEIEPMDRAGLRERGELKLDFSDSLPAAQAETAAPPPPELPDIDLHLRADTAATAHVDASLEPPAEQTAPPELDFSVKEPAESAGLLDLDKLSAPPPPLKLSVEAEALMQATQKLTRRTRRGKKKSERAEEPVEFVPIEPPAEPDPFAGLPPIENFDPFAGMKTAPVEPLPGIEPPSEQPSHLEFPAPATDEVEILERTEPEPASALDLDAAVEQVALDDSAVARALAEPKAEELSDAKFTNDVQELSGDSIGDIVEPIEPSDLSEFPPSAPILEEDEPPSSESAQAPAATHVQPTDEAEADASRTEDLVIPREFDIPAGKRVTPPSPAPPPPSAPAPAPPAASPPPTQPKPPRRDPFLVGANQENFLGGIPVPRGQEPLPPPPKLKTKPVPFNRDPVEELIAEIDHAAAAAERARAQAAPPAAPAGEPPGLVSSMDPFAAPHPPQHPSRMRPVSRRGTEMGALPLKIDEMIPPFAGRSATDSAVTRGFDGLAMPPVRQADVFSAMSPPGTEAAGEASTATQNPAAPEPRAAPPGRGGSNKTSESALFAGISAAAQADAQKQRGQPFAPDESGGRRPVRPALSDLAPGGRPNVVYADEAEEEFDEAEHKRRINRRVWTLVLVMFGLIGIAVAGIYSLLPVQSRLEASIRYLNLDKRTERDRREIQADQVRRIQSDYLREAARKKLLQTPEISPGFLEDPVKYTRVVDRAHWPEPRSGTVRALVLVSQGSNKEAEAARLRALAAALYDDNKFTLRKAADEARNAVNQLNTEIAQNTRRRDELNGEIASQRILYEQKPSADQVRLLESKLARLEDAWKRAVASVKDTEAELERIRTGAPGDNPALINDEELANMQRELEQLQARLDEARQASAEKADEARKRLDEAMAGFQQEIASARDAMKDNPELAAYIAAAEQLQDATRQLIDDLIRRQEQQFNSLMELKARLNEKMESRRADMWQADKELQALTERLAILTRQFNAAVGGGLKNEAEDLRAQVDLTKSMIKARQELIPADPGYAEAIQQLEQFINSTQKNIEEDRRRTDDLLAKLQRGFTSGPQIEKLPAEQKELAQRLVGKLESINEARTEYNASLDEGAAAGGAQLQQQIAALTAGIEARKKQHAAQMAGGVNSEMFKQKQAQLDKLQTEAKSAEEAFFAARQELDSANRAVADARAGYEKLEKLESERNQLQTLLKTQNDTLVERQRELAAAVEPQPLGENDIRITEDKDRRPTYSIIVSIAIAGVFMGLIVLTLYRGADPGSLMPANLRPITHPVPQPTANGNGQGNAPRPNGNSPNEDDRQPAMI